MEFQFETMDRVQSKLSVAVYGPSGAGKTVALLKLAKGIQKQLYPNESLQDIGLYIDTERRSSTKVAGRSVGGEALEPLELYSFEPPYDIIKLAELIDYAVTKKGKKIIVIDSYTAFWCGMDGILDRAAELEVELGSQKKAYGPWSEKEIIKKKNILKNLMTNANAHILIGFRAKTEYVMEPNRYGKMAPRAVGLKEDMQQDVRYEFDAVISIDKETHGANVVKDRVGFMELRAVGDNPEGPITINDGMLLAGIAAQGLSLAEVVSKKKDTLVNFLTEAKAKNDPKLGLFEQKKGIEISKGYLEKLSYDQLTKLVQYIKN